MSHHCHHAHCHSEAHEHLHAHENEHHHHHEHGHHHHDHDSHLRIATIALSIALLLIALWVSRQFSLATGWQFLLFLPAYLVAGYDTLAEALRGLFRGALLDEHFLMVVASLGAMSIGFLPEGHAEFIEAVAVMIFFQIGEMFEEYAEGKSHRSIAHLLSLRPDTAHVLGAEGIETVACADVAVGTTLLVKPGERIPLDGIVVEGRTSIDTSALTGESVPREIAPGDEAKAGCINLQGVIQLRTTHVANESTAARMIELVEHAGEKKSRSEAFITRFARIYTPIVVVLAIGICVVPPLFAASYSAALTTWLHRALIFLATSCPCALVISVPLTFFAGIGAASRQGILVKGANYIDTLAAARTVIFDKTGTLTEGRFAVTAVHPSRYPADTLLHLAAHVERHSTHPIATALRNAFPQEATDACRVTDITELAGCGITATVNDQRVSVGNAKLMDALALPWKTCHSHGTIVHVAIDGEYAGHIVVDDTLKPHAATLMTQLQTLGVQQRVILTGDNAHTAAHVAKQIGLTDYAAELSPVDKVEKMEQLLSEAPHVGSVVFVGDGINDSPVLARADVGIAMGGMGAEAAIEAADVVVMDDDLRKIPTLLRLSRRTLAIARENIIFAIGIKVIVLLLAAIGLATMWMAVFADVGVTICAVFNAMRAATIKQTAKDTCTPTPTE